MADTDVQSRGSGGRVYLVQHRKFNAGACVANVEQVRNNEGVLRQRLLRVTLPPHLVEPLGWWQPNRVAPAQSLASPVVAAAATILCRAAAARYLVVDQVALLPLQPKPSSIEHHSATAPLLMLALLTL